MTEKQPDSTVLTDEEFEKIIAKREKQTSYPNDNKYTNERKINSWINELVTENEQQRIEVGLTFFSFFFVHNCIFT